MGKAIKELIAPPTKKIQFKDIIPFPGNPRLMSAEDFQNLRESIKDHGLVQLVIVDEQNRILGGNQRLRALKKEGYGQSLIPCTVVDCKGDEKKARLLNLRLNRIHGEFDTDALFKFMENFDSEDIQAAGFDSDEMEELRKLSEEADEDLDEQEEEDKTRVSFDADTAANKVALKFGGFKCKVKAENYDKFMTLFEHLMQDETISSEAGYIRWLVNSGRRASKKAKV